MGYREDIELNYNINRSQLAIEVVKQSVLEDLFTQKAIAKALRQKQNLFQARYRATYEAYQKANPAKLQPEITLDELEKVDPGIKEQARQVMSYEQGTISGTARDSIAKIEQNLEGIISISEK